MAASQSRFGLSGTGLMLAAVLSVCLAVSTVPGAYAFVTFEVTSVTSSSASFTWEDARRCITIEEAKELGVVQRPGYDIRFDCSGINLNLYDPLGNRVSEFVRTAADDFIGLDHTDGGPGKYILQITDRYVQGRARDMPENNIYYSYTVPGPPDRSGEPKRQLRSQEIHDNVPPTFGTVTRDYSTIAGQEVTFPLRIVDEDSDAADRTLKITKGKGEIRGESFAWTPEIADSGTVNNVRIRMHDGELGIADFNAQITVRESRLTLRVDGERSIFEGESFALQMAAADADNDPSTWNYTLQSAPEGMTVNGSGRITWDPSDDQGPGRYTFTAVVSHPDDEVRVRVTLTIVADPSGFQEPVLPAMFGTHTGVERIMDDGETIGYVSIDFYTRGVRANFMAFMLEAGTYRWALLDSSGNALQKSGSTAPGSSGTFTVDAGAIAEFDYAVAGAVTMADTAYILRISDNDGNTLHNYDFRTRDTTSGSQYYMPWPDLSPRSDNVRYTILFKEPGVHELGVSTSASTSDSVIAGTDTSVNSTGTFTTGTGRVSGLSPDTQYYFHLTQAGQEFAGSDQVAVPFRTLAAGAEIVGAVADTYQVDGISTSTFNVLANDDIDPPSALDDVHIGTQGTKGMATVNANNTITYTTQTNEDTTDTFTYWLETGNIPTFADAVNDGASATVTVNILSRYINQPPMAQNFSLPAFAGETVYEYLGRHIDDPERGNLTVTITQQGSKGTAQIITASDTLAYTANTDGGGEDIVRYTVTDDHQLNATGTVTIQIEPIENEPPRAVDFNVAVGEDDNVSVNPFETGLASDPDGDELTIRITRQPDIGEAESGDNTVEYFSPPNSEGNTTDFEYTVYDGRGGNATGTVYVTIGNGTIPVTIEAVDDEVTVRRGVPHDIRVTENDTIEPITTSVDLRIIVLPTQGTAERVENTRLIRYTANLTATGTDMFVYALSQGGSNDINATVRININATNTPPMAQSFTIAAESGNVTRIDLADRISDQDQSDETLEVEISQNATKGSTRLTENNVIFYTPLPGRSGTDTLRYTVTDGSRLSATGTITINITGTIQRPSESLLLPDVPDQTVAAHSTLRLDITANGTGAIRYSINPPVPGAHINPVTGHLVWVPSESQTGRRTLDVQAADDTGSAATTINVTVGNPVATVNAITRDEDHKNTLDYTAGGSGVIAVFRSLIGSNNDTHSEPESTGAGQSGSELVGTYLRPHPEPNTIYYVEIRPESGSPGSDGNVYAQFTIGRTGFVIIPNPNTAPSPNSPPAASDFSITAAPSQTVTVDLADRGDISDINQDARTLLAGIADPAPAQGDASATGPTISYQARNDATGTDMINYTVTDGSGRTDTGTIMVTISGSAPPPPGPNRDPVAPDILINAELHFPSAVTPAVTDPDGDDITITRVTGNTLGSLDTSMLPQISYTPSQTGIDRLSYTASDNKGGTDTGTITIFINPGGNARPALDHIYNIGGRVGTDLEFTATADDSDDTSLTFDIANAPDGAGITPGGDFSWRPTSSQNGTHTVTFIVYDDSGGADWQHVLVTILRADETNLPPMPQDIDAGVVLGGGRGFQPDIVDPEGDMTEITRVYDSSLGDVDRSFLSQGIIVYVAGVLGDDEVIYTISDGRGGFANGTISITVEEPANVRPLIEFVGDKSVNANNELAFTVDARDLDGFVINFGLEGETQGPSMSPQGVFSWTPTANDVGRHEFTILVFDDAGDNSSVTIAVTVRPVGYRNSPPVAPDVVIMTPQDVLSIVRPTLTDPDEGDPVLISETGNTAKGSILTGFLRAGIIIYLPNQGETGTETITYTVSDSSGDTDTADINVFISARGNTDPILGSIDFRNINAGNPLGFDLEADDPDGDTVSYLLVGAPGNTAISSDGAFSWTPAAADVGNHTFTVIAYDDRGGADSKSAVIRVLPAGTANQAPSAPDSTVTVAPGGSVVITPAISDPDGDRVTITDAVASGTGVVIQSEDSINYIHVATTPTETITYTVTDARGATSTGTITVTIQ